MKLKYCVLDLYLVLSSPRSIAETNTRWRLNEKQIGPSIPSVSLVVGNAAVGLHSQGRHLADGSKETTTAGASGKPENKWIVGWVMLRLKEPVEELRFVQ